MPQLIPDFFVNQVSFVFSILVSLLYIISKYTLPAFVLLFVSRVAITNLISPANSNSFSNISLQSNPTPGVKCPNCLSQGQNVWVFPGFACPRCGRIVGIMMATLFVSMMLLGCFAVFAPNQLGIIINAFMH